MQSEKMSNELKTAFQKAYKTAGLLRDTQLRIEHIIYGILTTENIIKEIVYKKISDYDLLISEIEEHNKSISENDEQLNTEILIFEESLTQLIRKTSIKKNNENITITAFFLMTMELDNKIVKIINDYGITKIFMQKKLKELVPKASTFPLDDSFEKKNPPPPPTNKQKTKTPVLDSFSRDLTTLAIEGKIDPVIGRDAEIQRVAQILTRRKKNSPILIGESGVGKCILKNSLICIKNSVTGEIFNTSILDFLNTVTNTN